MDWLRMLVEFGFENPAFTHVVGLVGNVLSVGLWVPAAYRVYVNRADPHSLRGSSLLQQFGIILNSVVWLAYSALTGAWWSCAPGLFTVPLAVFVIVLLVRAWRLDVLPEARVVGGVGVASFASSGAPNPDPLP